MSATRCECADSGCPVCHGAHEKHHRAVMVTGDPNNVVALVRIDMDDSPVFMCEACAADAMESGVFDMVEA